MNKVLFFDKNQKNELIAYINKQLEIKNRLLGLIITNTDRKTSGMESSKKAFKYERQIIMLQNLLSLSGSVKSREDLRNLNKMIDQYNSLEK